MTTNNNEPRRRWNRRLSDGAAWGENPIVEDDRVNTRARRPSLRFLVAETLRDREPIQLTAEFKGRIAEAVRFSAVTFTIFSLLVFSGQDIFPVAWIGNVFAISVLKPTFGDTLISAKDVFVPMIPVSIISWVVSFALGLLESETCRLLLPFMSISASLAIFLCPWPYLTMKNLNLLIFYVSVASPLSLRNVESDDSSSFSLKEELGPWFVPALVGTCSIGLLVSLLVHIVIIKCPRSTTASLQIINLKRQVAHETNHLLLSLTRYIQSIGKASDVAQQSRTLIDFHVRRRRRIIKKLEEYLPAMRLESNLYISAGVDVDEIEAFVTCAKNQQKHAELVQVATQTLLGEVYTSQNSHVREVKVKISENLGHIIEKLAKEYSKSESVFFFDDSSKEDQKQVIDELQHSMEDYTIAMRQAIYDAEALLQNDHHASRSAAGPMIRARVTFLALFSFIHELHDVISTTKKESDEVPVTIMKRFMSCLRMTWLWTDISKRRLAIKTAIGLGLSSLWVSIPHLNGYLAYQNSIWVGVTVVSCSLETTGAAYTKAIDRLWGTLIAAAYTLFIGKVFHVTNAITKLLALTVITGISTFLTNPDRPYASRYTATSVGSILYGSFENKMEVDDYVSIRIMLICVGVVTFLFVEIILFPRSSRTIVQAQTMQQFEDFEHFFYQSSKTCALMSSVSGIDVSDVNLVDPLWMLRHGHKEVELTSSLADTVTAVKKTYALAKEELIPGILEPSLGLNISLDAVGYERLLSEIENIIVQLDLLVLTFQSLVGYYGHISTNHPVRDLQWPSLLSASLLRIAQQLSECADEFRLVFPHGVFRPGVSDTTQIIAAVSKFRHFGQIRLNILADVEDRYAAYFNHVSITGERVRYTPGFRLTLALSLSAMLGAAEGLQNCGLHLERIVQKFPLEEVNSSRYAPSAMTIQYGG